MLLNFIQSSNSSALERCDFFKCFEKRIPCGKDFWIMNWGHKYCTRYANPNFIREFTNSGKKFLNFVNKCLPRALKKLYKIKADQVSCKALSRAAFQAQANCYQHLNSNFCKGFVENKSLFIKVLDKSDFFNMDSISVITNSTKKCHPKINMLSLLFSIG